MSKTFEATNIPAVQPIEGLPNQSNGELQSIHTTYWLNWKNYLQWSQIVKTFLKGKRKMNHLLGTGPEQSDSNFQIWDEEDSMIMSWLWNLMLPEISSTFMFLSTAKGIWCYLRQTYSKIHDVAQIIEIKTDFSHQRRWAFGDWICQSPEIFVSRDELLSIHSNEG